MMAQTIVPGLAAGQTVICDRFVSSTLAYQLGGDGLTAEQIRAIADIAIKSGWPDLTIILDIPIAQSFARVQRARDRIEQRPAEYHEQVRRNYLAQAAGDPLRYRVINADRPTEQVHTDIWSAIMNVLG
jgi:dTMP kinase